MQKKKVLVIDDDRDTLQLLTLSLSGADLQIFATRDGQEGLRIFYNQKPDLVILDVMMPLLDGWQVYDRIREMADVPVIFLTCLDQEQNIVRGLEAGAVDYIIKPFRPNVLIARVQAALRKVQTQADDAEKRRTIYDDGHLVVDLDAQQVCLAGKPVNLSDKEFRLLTVLLENAGQVLSFQQILERVWGWEYRDAVDYVHVYISHLRRKLGEDSRNPRYLLTEHRVGYRFNSRPLEVEAR